MENVKNNIKGEQYSDYKDSFQQWLGDIPKHWEILPSKRFHQVKKQPNSKRECDNVLSLTLRGVVNNDPDSPEGMVPKDYGTYQIFEKENLVFKLIDLENVKTSRVGIVHEKGIMSSAYIRLIIGDGNLPRFTYYYFYCLYINQVYNNLGSGVRSTLGPTDLLNIPYLKAPLPEQTAIAAFLDRKTALIDQAMGIKQKQIELLKERRQILIHKAVTRGLNQNVKMKDSGVEWIGEIPEGWKKSHLKWVTKVFAGGTPDKANIKYWEDGTIPWIASGEVNQETIKYPTTYITKAGFANSSARWIEKDALVVALAGQGKTKGMVAYLEINTTGNQSLAAVIPNKERIYPKYLFYYLMAAYKELRGVSGEGQRDGLNLQKLGDLFVCIPSLIEQLNISTYLESASEKIYTAISLKEQEIEKLKEYKATLINSAVTGKIKVSNNAK